MSRVGFSAIPEPLVALGVPVPRTRASANSFVFGVIFNQAQRAEKSWAAPALLKKRVRTLDPRALLHLTISDLAKAIAAAPALHRQPQTMAFYILGASDVLVDEYSGDARRLWAEVDSTEELCTRLRAIPGIGLHKSIVAAFLLSELGIVPCHSDLHRVVRERCPGLAKRYAQWAAPD